MNVNSTPKCSICWRLRSAEDAFEEKCFKNDAAKTVKKGSNWVEKGTKVYESTRNNQLLAGVKFDRFWVTKSL